MLPSPDFESSASTSSATSAREGVYQKSGRQQRPNVRLDVGYLNILKYYARKRVAPLEDATVSK